MILIFGLLLMLILGFSIANLLNKKASILEKISLAYILGLGIVTLYMFLILRVSGKVSPGIVLATLAIVASTIVLFNRGKFKPGLREIIFKIISSIKILKFTSLEKILVTAIILINIYAVVVSLYWPVKDWDAITLYDFRAKILSSPTQSFSFMNANYDGYYYGYPLLTSLSHTFVYILNGENPVFLYGLFFVSLSILFYGILRQVSSRVISLLSVLVLVTLFSFIQQITSAYTNLPFAIYYSLGTLYLYLWMAKKGGSGNLIIGCLLVALSFWTRDSEPFWIADFGVLIVYAIFERNILGPLIFWGINEPVRMMWNSFKERIAHYYTNDQVARGFMVFKDNLNFQRILEVTNFISVSLTPIYSQIIGLFLVCLMIDIKNIFMKERLYILMIIFFNFSILFLGTYTLSYIFTDWLKIPGSVERIFMIFPPLIIFYAAMVLESFKTKTLSKL